MTIQGQNGDIVDSFYVSSENLPLNFTMQSCLYAEFYIGLKVTLALIPPEQNVIL